MSGRRASASRKITVPSPLPFRRGEVHLPPQLRQDVMEALMHKPGAIQDIQKTLDSTLESEGWKERVRIYITEVLRNTDEGDVDDDEIQRRVLASLMPQKDRVRTPNDDSGAIVQRELWAGEAEARAKLNVPLKCVDATAEAVKRELKQECKVVDAVDWDG